MAMIKPIGKKKEAFDATKNETFYFTSVGGDAVVQNKIIIRDNETNNIVYTKTTSLGVTEFSQVVPSNSLVNGKNYNYSFVTYNINGDSSEESSPIQFYCFNTPIISFDNLYEGQTIFNASYEFVLNYSQEQDELLDFVKFYVYDFDNNLIAESGNITTSNTPPTTVSYKFDGFNDNENYSIIAKAVTLNGQSVETDRIHFSVIYDKTKQYDVFNVSNECSKGYNEINVSITNINGKLTPQNAEYIDGQSLDLSKYGSNVLWENNVKISKEDNQFILQLWFKACNVGKFAILGDVESGNYFQFNWVREIPYNRTELKDYVEVSGYVNNVRSIYIYTDYMDLVNNFTNVYLWFKYDGMNSSLMVGTSGKISNNIYWGNKSNSDINYGMLTDIKYTNSSYLKVGDFKYISTEDMIDAFPIERVQLFNGVFDHINITTDITKEYDLTIPTKWDYYTVLNCNFESNVNGGILNFDDLEYVRVKAREKGTFDWLTIKNVRTAKEDTISLSIKDYRVPSYTDMEYALVLVNNNGIESSYSIKSLDNVLWNKVFISDMTGTTMILETNVSYSELERVGEIGQVQPINSKYPIIIENGEVDYEQMTISGWVIDDRNSGGYATKEIKKGDIVVSRSKYLDRKYLTKKRNEYLNFLKNGKTKVITDWNGNCWIGKIVQNPSFSPMQEMGNGLGSVTFSFAEQGKWNNQEDLYKTNLVEEV